jgi:hypothetical protein
MRDEAMLGLRGNQGNAVLRSEAFVSVRFGNDPMTLDGEV